MPVAACNQPPGCMHVGDGKAVSARELLQRLSGDNARKSNPACKVEFNIDEDAAHGTAFIDLMFNDNTQ